MNGHDINDNDNSESLSDGGKQVLAALEEMLLSLLDGEHTSLSLKFNDDNGPNYQTVAQMVESFGDENRDWVSPLEKQKAIATNRMWTLQWYPNSPVGFSTLSAASLPALFEALAEANGDGK